MFGLRYNKTFSMPCSVNLTFNKDLLSLSKSVGGMSLLMFIKNTVQQKIVKYFDFTFQMSSETVFMEKARNTWYVFVVQTIIKG